MKTPWILLSSILILPGLAMARTKTYDINVPDLVTVRNVQLEPGDYRMKIEGTNAIFNDSRTGKSFTVPAKIENGSQKFQATALETSKKGSTNSLTAIELGGSKTKIEFE